MGIKVASNFEVKASLPIDSRYQVANIEERDSIAAGVRYDGLQVYVKEEESVYVLKGGIENTNWEKLITESQIDIDLPLESGEGIESMQQPNSIAMSDNDIALGVDNVSGLKGFYIKNIDFENKGIFLSGAKVDTSVGAGDVDSSFETPQYKEGALFSVIVKDGDSRNHYHFCATIKSVTHNRIIYDGDLPFRNILNESSIRTNTFFVPSQPEIGSTIISYGSYSEGAENKSGGRYSHAEGRANIAAGDYSHVEGLNTQAGYTGHAEGEFSKAYGYGGHAEGYGAMAIGGYSHAEGGYSHAEGTYSHAEGGGTTAKGNYSHSEGNSTTASNDAAHAEGYGTSASGIQSHAEGKNSKATAPSAHAEGNNTEASGDSSHAEGLESQATMPRAHAEGYGSKAFGINAHAEGQLSTASGNNAHAEGQGTTASGNYAHAEGYISEASANGAHAEGEGTKATAQNSHAEGLESNATNVRAHAEGYKTTAGGVDSHAEGNNTQATGSYSHSEGYNTQATKKSAHAEGSNAKATGEDSHAEGNNTKASGYRTHAEGFETVAKNTNSHAEGYQTVTGGDNQHVQGKWNKEMGASYAHVVGNGSNNDNRSNAHTLDWDGNAWFAGDVKVGANNKKLLTNDDISKVAMSGNYIDLANRPVVEDWYSQISNDKSHLLTIGGIEQLVSQNIPIKICSSNPMNMDLDSEGGTAFFYISKDIPNDSVFLFQQWVEDWIEEEQVKLNIFTQTIIDSSGIRIREKITCIEETDLVHGWEWKPLNDYTPTIDMVRQSISDLVDSAPETLDTLNELAAALGEDPNFATTISTKLGEKVDTVTFNEEIEKINDSIDEVAIPLKDGEGSNSLVQGNTTSNWNPDNSEANTKIVEYTKNGTVNENGLAIQVDDTGKIIAGAFGSGSAAFGTKSQALGGKSFAEGSKTVAFANNSHAEGNSTFAADQNTHAEGYKTTALGYNSHAEGKDTIAIGKNSHVEGNTTEAVGDNAHAEGFETDAIGETSHAEGTKTVAFANNSHAEGNSTIASGTNAHAEGNTTTAFGPNSHTEGNGTFASGENSHAEGYETKASGNMSHAEGEYSEAYGDMSHAEGENTKARGFASHTEGRDTIVEGNYSHAEGWGTVSRGRSQHVQGEFNIIDYDSASTPEEMYRNKYAHIVGNGTDDNNRSNAHTLDWEGNAWFAGKITVGPDNKPLITADEVETVGKKGSGENSEIFNDINNIASGMYSHAEGFFTEATREYSHAEGYFAKAYGERSHAEGSYCEARGYSSHAEGYRTVAVGTAQHVQGRYNIIDSELDEGNSKYAHIVGNGSFDGTRSNAYTLDWEGNGWFAGNVTVGPNNSKLITEAEVDAKLSEIPTNAGDGLTVVTEITEAATDSEKPTALAVKNYVYAAIADALEGEY